MKNKVLIIILLFIAVASGSFAQDITENGKNNTSYSSSDPATSIYLRYNLTRPDYANSPYFLGFDLGTDLDLGGEVYLLKLCGIGFSGKYILFNNKNEATNEISYSHYLSSGISFYLKTRFENPVNYGFRLGTGSGWLISAEIDEYTQNNKRLNGIYFDGGFFSEFKLSENYFIETGVDIRTQRYYKKDQKLDPVDIGFIYLKAGIKL